MLGSALGYHCTWLHLSFGVSCLGMELLCELVEKGNQLFQPLLRKTEGEGEEAGTTDVEHRCADALKQELDWERPNLV